MYLHDLQHTPPPIFEFAPVLLEGPAVVVSVLVPDRLGLVVMAGAVDVIINSVTGVKFLSRIISDWNIMSSQSH